METMKRREFLKLFAIGVGVFSFFNIFPRIIMKAKELVRPPGSLTEDAFNATCIRCGKCAQVCPTGAIVLTDLNDGFKELGTPKIDPLRGACERIQGRCDQQAKCAQICPTGSIQHVDRPNLKLGSSILNLGNCLAWHGKLCIVCYEVCPVPEAISITDEAKPSFNENSCVGCGRCVNACPAQPKALTLTTKGEKRLLPA